MGLRLWFLLVVDLCFVCVLRISWFGLVLGGVWQLGLGGLVAYGGCCLLGVYVCLVSTWFGSRVGVLRGCVILGFWRCDLFGFLMGLGWVGCVCFLILRLFVGWGWCGFGFWTGCCGGF